MESKIRRIEKSDLGWIENFFTESWGSNFIISQGKIHRPEDLEGFIWEENGEIVGLITTDMGNDGLEIITLNSLEPNRGIGSELIKEILGMAKERGLKRVWLITTNDNLAALKFYQKRGFRLVAIYPNALAESRKLKPQIPEIGENGIPLRDEIELEILLS